MLAAIAYFYGWFEIDYGVSIDEPIGFATGSVGALLLFTAWLDGRSG